MDSFLSVASDKILKGEFEIKKSRFLSFAKYVTTNEEAEEFLKTIKKEHQTARHIVFAYKLLNTSKMSDDGEPSGTAGKPILNLIEKVGLFNVVVVVVRYFGGIKLGAGPLLRAYVESATKVLSLPLNVYERCFKSRVEMDFKDFEAILPFSSKGEIKIFDPVFSDKVSFSVIYPKNFNKKFENESEKHEIFYSFEVKNA